MWGLGGNVLGDPIFNVGPPSDNGSYVVWNQLLCSLPVVGPRTVPFIVEETAPDTGEVNTNGTMIQATSYDIRIAFEPDPHQHKRAWWQHGSWFDVEAVETTPASVGVNILVGQDLLQKVVMSWDGPRWKLLLMY